MKISCSLEGATLSKFNMINKRVNFLGNSIAFCVILFVYFLYLVFTI